MLKSFFNKIEKMDEEGNIVVNDLLCYLLCKIYVVPKESLVQVITNFYKQDAIIAAREILYRDLPVSLPRVIRHVNKRDNVSAMYDVMQALMADTSKVFVCRDLNNIPPLSFKNVDPVMLLQQTADMHNEMSVLQQTQGDVKSQLNEMKETLNHIRDTVCSAEVEKPSTSYGDVTKRYLQHKGGQLAGASCQSVEFLNSVLGVRESRVMPSRDSQESSDGVPVGGADEESRDSFAKSDSRYFVDGDGFKHRKPRHRKPPVIGTGKQSKLRAAVSRKRREIFVTRLHEDTSCKDIRDYVHSVTSASSCEVEKLNNKHPGNASFRVSCEEQHFQLLLSGESWDDGIMVRPFFPAKKQRNLTTSQNIEDINSSA